MSESDKLFGTHIREAVDALSVPAVQLTSGSEGEGDPAVGPYKPISDATLYALIPNARDCVEDREYTRYDDRSDYDWAQFILRVAARIASDRTALGSARSALGAKANEAKAFNDLADTLQAALDAKAADLKEARKLRKEIGKWDDALQEATDEVVRLQATIAARNKSIATRDKTIVDLQSALDEAKRDTERLDWLLWEQAAHSEDRETQEQRVRCDWDSGWCINPRDVIDAEIATLAARAVSRGEADNG